MSFSYATDTTTPPTHHQHHHVHKPHPLLPPHPVAVQAPASQPHDCGPLGLNCALKSIHDSIFGQANAVQHTATDSVLGQSHALQQTVVPYVLIGGGILVVLYLLFSGSKSLHFI